MSGVSNFSAKKVPVFLVGGVGGLVLGGLLITQVFDVSFSLQPKFSLLKRTIPIVDQSSGFRETNSSVDVLALQQQVLPSQGIVLPIQWKGLGKRMVEDGVIDEQSFRSVFPNQLPADEEQILTDSTSPQIVMNANNSRFLLDVLWAFGLSNKNDILETGEMTDKQYGGAGNFASTGGWTLSKGKAMDHYSKHAYVSLTPEQQALVDKVSRNIYRPCCGNSTHFPDCNHGMAMLGLLELMAANGANEQEMYKVALQVNAYWFPQTYIDLATYFKEQGSDWKNVDPKVVLSAQYSSAAGYQTTRQQIKSLPQLQQGGGGCGT